MGRRKKDFVCDDGDSSEGERPGEDDDNDAYDGFDDYKAQMARLGVSAADLADEMAVAGNRRKKQRRTKEDAIYGIFGEEEDDDGGGYGRRGGAGKNGSAGYMAGVKFVSSSSKNSKEMEEDEHDSDEGSDGDDEDGSEDRDEDVMDVDERDDAAPMEEDEELEDAPRIRLESEHPGLGSDRPGLGSGFGSGWGVGGAGLGFGRPGLGMNTEDDADSDGPRPGLGSSTSGLGFNRSTTDTPPPRGGLGSSTQPGLGFPISSRSGLGTSSPTLTPSSADTFIPTSFTSTRQNRQSRKATIGPTPSTPYKPTKPIDKDFAKFEQHTKGFGLKMLKKMGYVEGQGLGADGRGIATPIDVKVRPSKMGIGHRGFDERTEAVKREQREKGLDSDDDDELTTAKKEKKPKVDGWKKSSAGVGGKGRKKKPQYKTAEEIIREQESGPVPLTADIPQSSKIIDMTGKQTRVLDDLSNISSTAPFEESKYIPELLHNVRLIADLAKGDLEHVGRQIRIEASKREVLEKDTKRLEAAVEDEALVLSRLKGVQAIVEEIEKIGKSFTLGGGSLSTDETPEEIFGHVERMYGKAFGKLEGEFYQDVVLYGLDEVVVAALGPVFKKAVREWDVLGEPG
ncbi:hypothetical protein HK097_004179, partial [Rhizophlyctis rosea]